MSDPKTASIATAKEIAYEAHEGQFRRDGKTPYIYHPAMVAARVGGDHAKMVAWLHDVLEDTGVTREILMAKGVPEVVVQAVELLTKVEGKTWIEYLEPIGANELARRVKVADMLCNLSDTPTRSQIKRYARGLLYLLGRKGVSL